MPITPATMTMIKKSAKTKPASPVNSPLEAAKAFPVVEPTAKSTSDAVEVGILLGPMLPYPDTNAGKDVECGDHHS